MCIHRRAPGNKRPVIALSGPVIAFARQLRQDALMETPPHTAPLRIIQVVNVRWFNATAWYGLFLAKLLREAGHEVLTLGLGGTESFAKAEEWGLSPMALPLNDTNPLAVAALTGKLRRLIRDFTPDIVNCHRGESFALWAALKALSGNGFGLVRTRGDQRPPKGGIVNAYLHTRAADGVIATCSAIAEAFRARLRVPENQLHTIYGGVDTRLFYRDANGRAAARASLGLGPKDCAIGLVGRFDAVKGQKELIEAFAKMKEAAGQSSRRPRLVLAGFATSSTSEETVRSWASEAGLGDDVLFPGRVPDVRGLLNALDLGVVASLGSETIARVALEVMACGVPLIGTTVGVMPDLLDAEALVPPGDTGAMADLLRRFLAGPEYGETLCVAQEKRMQTLSEKDFLEQTLAVYRQVAAKRAGLTN